MNIVYLNGEFIAKEKAMISIFDRGFLFGDALYEVIPIIDGGLLGEEIHLRRLMHGLDTIHINCPMQADDWHQILVKLLEINDLPTRKEGYHIYLQVSRGTQKKRTHSIKHNSKPTVVAFIQENSKPDPRVIAQGLSAITIEDPRRQNCELKSTSLIANILALNSAINADSTEAIFINDGHVMEGTQSNVFVVHDKKISTPNLNSRVLPGVTRQLLMEFLATQNMPCKETAVTEQQLHNADEIWITGSIKGIYPIVSLNQQPVGQGRPGPVWNIISELFSKHTISKFSPPAK